MSGNENDKKSSKDKGKKRYELSIIDLRFLKVVDTIIEKNKAAKIEPQSDSATSKIIFGDRYAISKIRGSHRGVTISQLEKTIIYFNLDSNCFFRDVAKIEYNPEAIGDAIEIKDHAQVNYGGGNINTANGNNNKNHFGDNNYHGDIKDQLEAFKKIVNKAKCSPATQKKFDFVLEKIQDKSTHLETILGEKTKSLTLKTESLKKTTSLLNLESSNRKKAEKKTEKVEKERDKAKEKEQEIKDKYILLFDKYTSLLEKIN